MINFILEVGTILLVVYLFTKIRGFIFKRTKKVITMYPPIVGLNASIGKSYKKGKESFSWTKFKKIFDLGDGVEWIKSIKEIIDLRKLTIYIIIISAFFAYGYFKGRGNTPIKIDLDYTKNLE